MRRALVLLALVGCTPSFQDESTVVDLRVLAMVADPPEILIDIGDPRDLLTDPTRLAEALNAVPDALPPVNLRPLVVDPAGEGRPVWWELRACGRSGGQRERGRNEGPGMARDAIGSGPCPADALLVSSGEAAPATGSVEVPIEATLTITRDFLLQAVSADPTGVVLGLPINVQLTVRAGDEQVITTKRVVVGPQIDDQPPNANPRMTRVSFRAADDQPFTSIDPARTATMPLEVPLDGELALSPDQEPLEPYRAWAVSRRDGSLYIDEVGKETVRYNFYSTRGRFGPDDLDTQPSPLLTNTPERLITRYHAPRTLSEGDDGRVHAWVVVRDERGGSSVARLFLQIR